jgi:hypothetical protein
VDHKDEHFNVEAGLGYGMTAAFDRWVAKPMLSRNEPGSAK